AGVRYYAIVDELPHVQPRRLEIIGLERGKRVYRQLRVNAQGRLWLETLGAWLGQESGQVVCWDQAGQRIGDIADIDQARQAAEQGRQVAEERVRQLEEELRRRRGQ